MKSKEEQIEFIMKYAKKRTVIDGAIQIDPNDWNDVDSWYEYKPEHSRLIAYNRDYIEKIAKERELNLIDAVEYVWKEKYEYKKNE